MMRFALLSFIICFAIGAVSAAEIAAGGLLDDPFIDDSSLWAGSPGSYTFQTNSGTMYETDDGRGWVRPTGHRWSLDAVNQYAVVDSAGGAQGLCQVIDGSLAGGAGSLSLWARNVDANGAGNELRIQVYGINGSFELSNWNTKDPVAKTEGDPDFSFAKLLDVTEAGEYDWTEFTYDSVSNPGFDFATGWDSVAVRLYTSSVTPEGGDEMAVDNVVLLPEPASAGLIALGGLVTIVRRRRTR
jgi:hypothetical protein